MTLIDDYRQELNNIAPLNIENEDNETTHTDADNAILNILLTANFPKSYNQQILYIHGTSIHKQV